MSDTKGARFRAIQLLDQVYCTYYDHGRIDSALVFPCAHPNAHLLPSVERSVFGRLSDISALLSTLGFGFVILLPLGYITPYKELNSILLGSATMKWFSMGLPIEDARGSDTRNKFRGSRRSPT